MSTLRHCIVLLALALSAATTRAQEPAALRLSASQFVERANRVMEQIGASHRIERARCHGRRRGGTLSVYCHARTQDGRAYGFLRRGEGELLRTAAFAVYTKLPEDVDGEPADPLPFFVALIGTVSPELLPDKRSELAASLLSRFRNGEQASETIGAVRYAASAQDDEIWIGAVPAR